MCPESLHPGQNLPRIQPLEIAAHDDWPLLYDSGAIAPHSDIGYIQNVMADGNVSFHYRIYLKNRPGNPVEVELLSETLKDDFAGSGDGCGITNNYQTASGGVFVVRLDEIAALQAEVINAA